MNKDNVKQVVVSVVIGACVAFFSTLFQGLADLLKSHSVEIISGISSSSVYLAKMYKG